MNGHALEKELTRRLARSLAHYNVDERGLLTLVFAKFKELYPEYKDSKRLVKPNFSKGHKIIEVAFPCLSGLYAQIYRELNLSSVVSYTEYMAECYVDVPRVLIFYMYHKDNHSLKDYLKSRVRYITTHYKKTIDSEIEMNLQVVNEEVQDHNDHEGHDICQPQRNYPQYM